MAELDSEQKKEIVAALKERGALQACPRCGNEGFALADGYFNELLQTEPADLKFDVSSVPSVIVICRNCGFMSQHALGILGFLENGEVSGALR